MNHVPTTNNEICFREPTRWSWLFTVPLFWVLAGLVVPVALGFVPDWSGFTHPARLIAFVGVLFLAWKANSWFGRLSFSIDASRKVLRRKWGLFYPLLGRNYPLKDYKTLRFSGIRTTHTRNYAVAYTEDTWYLHLVKDKQRILLGRDASREDMLGIAQDVAEEADLTLIDDTFDPPQQLRTSQRALKNLSPLAGLMMTLLAHAQFDPSPSKEEDSVQQPAVEPSAGINFSCPSCSAELEFGADAAGSTLRCPFCKNSVTVPAG